MKFIFAFTVLCIVCVNALNVDNAVAEDDNQIIDLDNAFDELGNHIFDLDKAMYENEDISNALIDPYSKSIIA